MNRRPPPGAARNRRRPPQYRSLDHGRRSEADVARRLTRWADGVYTFRRRGLGHAGVGDLVVTGVVMAPWPFTISVKSGRGPTLTAMLHLAGEGEAWPWWLELEHGGSGPAPIFDTMRENRERAWLVWRSERLWMLSVWSLGMLNVPVRLALLPPPLTGWPRYTMILEQFLGAVTIDQVVTAIADGWGKP